VMDKKTCRKKYVDEEKEIPKNLCVFCSVRNKEKCSNRILLAKRGITVK